MGDRSEIHPPGSGPETQKTLAIHHGHTEQRIRDRARHGTITLFTALEIASAQDTQLCENRHRNLQFLAFLKHVGRAYPDQDLHLVMDNSVTKKPIEVHDWLASNPRIRVHFTPTSESWLKLVEVLFSIIEKQAIQRGSFTSVHELMVKMRTFIKGWNARQHPFIWTKTADEFLVNLTATANPPRRQIADPESP